MFRIWKTRPPTNISQNPMEIGFHKIHKFRKYAQTPTFDVCDLMTLVTFKYVCCFPEFMYFLILNSIGCWLIFECCSHLQNTPRSCFKGSWRVELPIIVRWSCIINAWIQATGASTTGGECFVLYTEYNTQEFNKIIKCMFSLFASHATIHATSAWAHCHIGDDASGCEHAGLHSVLVGTHTHTSQLQCDTLDPHIVRHPRGKRKKRTAEIVCSLKQL